MSVSEYRDYSIPWALVVSNFLQSYQTAHWNAVLHNLISILSLDFIYFCDPLTIYHYNYVAPPRKQADGTNDAKSWLNSYCSQDAQFVNSKWVASKVFTGLCVLKLISFPATHTHTLFARRAMRRKSVSVSGKNIWILTGEVRNQRAEGGKTGSEQEAISALPIILFLLG